MNLLNAYYYIKPIIPRRLQFTLRRQLVRRQRVKFKDVWPIDPSAGKAPEGWTGWPEGKQFALVLTHDVETAAGLEKCRPLLDLEEKLGFRSSFNFVPEDYPVREAFRRELTDRGFEVGLHGLTHKESCFLSREIFESQCNRINQYLRDWGVKGLRAPSMFHNLEWAHELAIEYDASTFDTDPFEPQPDGLRTIYPLWVPCPRNSSGYVELPYTLPQDHTLYLLLREKDNSTWKRKLDWVAQQGGMALMNTHPDYQHFKETKTENQEQVYPFEFYGDLLAYCEKTYAGKYWQVLPGIWPTSGEKILLGYKAEDKGSRFEVKRQIKNKLFLARKRRRNSL